VIEAGPALGGTTAHSGAAVNRNFPQCKGETVRVTLTVAGSGGSQASTSQAIQLPVTLESALDDSMRCVVESFLSTAGARGRVVLDGNRADEVEGAIPARHRVVSAAGERQVEATLVAGGAEGTWSFDFARCAGLLKGSLEPLGGTSVGVDSTRIVFRTTGIPGGRVAFRYRLSP
jgi:hypothetical protein